MLISGSGRQKHTAVLHWLDKDAVAILHRWQSISCLDQGTVEKTVSVLALKLIAYICLIPDRHHLYRHTGSMLETCSSGRLAQSWVPYQQLYLVLGAPLSTGETVIMS